MAVIAETDSRNVVGVISITQTTLTASDTLPYDSTKRQALVLANLTAGSLTATIDGADGTSVIAEGLGSVTVSGGLAVTVAANDMKLIILPTIRHYLQGVVTVTGAAGLKAFVVTL